MATRAGEERSRSLARRVTSLRHRLRHIVAPAPLRPERALWESHFRAWENINQNHAQVVIGFVLFDEIEKASIRTRSIRADSNFAAMTQCGRVQHKTTLSRSACGACPLAQIFLLTHT